MPDIGSMKYGTDSAGVSSYLEEIHSGALQAAKEAIKNTEEIKSTCDANWEGKAKENFLKNLETDGDHVNEQFDALYGILCETINSASAAMRRKDSMLID